MTPCHQVIVWLVMSHFAAISFLYSAQQCGKAKAAMFKKNGNAPFWCNFERAALHRSLQQSDNHRAQLGRPLCSAIGSLAGGRSGSARLLLLPFC